MRPYVRKRIKLNADFLLWYKLHVQVVSCVGTRGALRVALLTLSSDLFVWLQYLPVDCLSRILVGHTGALKRPLAFVAFSFVLGPPIPAGLKTFDLRAKRPFPRIST